MLPENRSYINSTMKDDLELESVCSDPNHQNTTLCDKQALGMNLSTPIMMLSTGVLGNLLALAVLYTSKKEVRKTVFFTLLVGLAWTDVIGQLCVGPIAIITYANNLKWQGGEPVCKYHGFMMVCFGVLTPLLVFAMSLERVLALRFTYYYSRVMTVRKAQVIIVVCWACTLFFCTWPFMGLGSYALQFPGSWCFLNFHRETASDAAYAYVFASVNVTIISLILVCNITVVITLLQMRRTRRINNSPSIERRLSVNGCKHRHILQMEMETQMVWFLGAITLVFCTCYLPLNVHILTGRNNQKQDLISIRLASINQILDPWLYILLRKATFFKLLRRFKRFVAHSIRRNNSRRRNPYVNSSKHLSNSGCRVESDTRGEICECAPTFQTNNKCLSVPLTRHEAGRASLHGGSSDSESDIFAPSLIRSTKASFMSVDTYFTSCTTTQFNETSHDKLNRLGSLPAYLQGNENDAVDVDS